MKETCEHHQRYRRRSGRPDQRAFREAWKDQRDQCESDVFEEWAVGGESHAPKLPCMALFPYDIKQGIISGFEPFHKGIPFFAIRRMLPNKKCIDDHDHRYLD